MVPLHPIANVNVGTAIESNGQPLLQVISGRRDNHWGSRDHRIAQASSCGPGCSAMGCQARVVDRGARGAGGGADAHCLGFGGGGHDTMHLLKRPSGRVLKRCQKGRKLRVGPGLSKPRTSLVWVFAPVPAKCVLTPRPGRTGTRSRHMQMNHSKRRCQSHRELKFTSSDPVALQNYAIADGEWTLQAPSRHRR
jgi:hypothetical protein